jgi:hypothetical protein
MPTFAHKRRFGHLILRPRIYQETRKPLSVWHVLPLVIMLYDQYLFVISRWLIYQKFTKNIGLLPEWIGNGVTGGDRDLIEGLSRHFSGGTPKTTKNLSQYAQLQCRYSIQEPPENEEKRDKS